MRTAVIPIAMTPATIERYRRIGWLLLVACGDARREPAGDGSSRLSADVAGGEASEFGGSSIFCLPISETALDLDDEDVAPWVAQVEVPHEVSFAWQRQFLTDAITGFEEKTRASIDVTVVEAYDVVFEPGCPQGGQRALQFELEVAVETADGALQGTFRHRVGTRPSSAPTLGEPLYTYFNPYTYEPTPLDDLSGSIDYGVDLDLYYRRELGVGLMFEGGSISGRLSPFLAPTNGREPGAGFSPIIGVFPEDECAFSGGRSIDLDGDLTGFLEATPRALYERAMSLWPGAIAATWDDGSSTELALIAGSPSRACETAWLGEIAWVDIHAPVRLETADARLGLDQTVNFRFTRRLGDDEVTTHDDYPQIWTPVDRFEQVTGIKGVDYASAEYARVEFYNILHLAAHSVTGSLAVLTWENVYEQQVSRPRLTW
jgi:hypothetical protein